MIIFILTLIYFPSAPNFSACEPDVEELDHDLHNFTDLENFSHTLFVSPTKEFL